MKPIIEVKGISKKYKLGVFNARTLREEAEAFLARFSRRKGDGRSEMGDRRWDIGANLLTPDFYLRRQLPLTNSGPSAMSPLMFSPARLLA